MDDLKASVLMSDTETQLNDLVQTGEGRRVLRDGLDDLVLMPEQEYRRLEQKLETLSQIALDGRSEPRLPAFNGQPKFKVSGDEFGRAIDRFFEVATHLDDVLIERASGGNVVLLSAQSFDGILTTIDIFADPGYARSLLDSVAECDRASPRVVAAAE